MSCACFAKRGHFQTSVLRAAWLSGSVLAMQSRIKRQVKKCNTDFRQVLVSLNFTQTIELGGCCPVPTTKIPASSMNDFPTQTCSAMTLPFLLHSIVAETTTLSLCQSSSFQAVVIIRAFHMAFHTQTLIPASFIFSTP